MPTLRRLPFSCRLWQAFRRFDEARQARIAELRALSHCIVKTAADDSVTDAEWALLTTRRERLTMAIEDPHNLLGELKATAELAENAWARV